MSKPDSQDFLSSYPFEIIKHIFSFLDQSECLECMRVCRQWSIQVPQYTTDLWKHVRFDLQSPNHQRVMRCLGPHVESLDLRQCDDDQPSAFLYSLGAIGCNNIKELEIYEGHKARKSPHIAVDALLQIGSSLRELTLHVSEEDCIDPHYLQILASCPSITHFSYINLTSSSSRMDDDEPYQVPDFPQLGLKYLHIDARWHESKDDYLVTLLQRSPQLKCLLVADLDYEEPYHEEWYTERWPTGYLRKFLDVCPNLQYFAWNAWLDEDVEHWKSRATVDSNTKGLLELVMRNVDNFFLQRFIPVMAGILTTLEVFTIQADYPGHLDWSPLAPLYADQLTKLELSLIEIESHVLSSIIRHAPALETVLLDFVESLFTNEILESLATLSNLRSLGFSNHFSQDVSRSESICQSIHRFFETECRQLQSLKLHGEFMASDDMLRAVSNITTLRKLNLSWRKGAPLDGLASLLHATSLHYVGFENVYFSENVVEAVNMVLMHQQDSLRGLSFSRYPVDDSILRTIADYQLPKLETLTILNADTVSSDMIQYAKCKLGRRVTINIS